MLRVFRQPHVVRAYISGLKKNPSYIRTVGALDASSSCRFVNALRIEAAIAKGIRAAATVLE